ncbi:MAG: NnrS family protein [Rhodospirillales bacterium]|nr:NnrS family protein [Rhodospirillales bacterium]
MFVSGFRPFYFLGTLYAPLLVLIWLAEYSGLAGFSSSEISLSQWHGHEMLFGFAAAVISGFLLTALPGWAATPEIHGAKLAFLSFLWLAGRVVFWFSAQLPLPLVAIVDSSLFLFMALFFVPGLRQAKSKLYWALIPILLWFFGCNVAFYWALAQGASHQADQALMAKVYGLILLYSIVAGILVPSFTETALKAKKWQGRMTILPWLEWAAVGTAFVYGLTGLLYKGSEFAIWAALVALVIHSFRFSRWKGLKVADTPMVFILHVGYAWMLGAFLLRALGDYGLNIPDMSHVHAYTIGALGLMKIGLMTRVALKHTGRPLNPSNLVLMAYALIFFAACIRLYAPYSAVEPAMMGLSSLAWALGFGIYFFSYGRLFLVPSLPRKG